MLTKWRKRSGSYLVSEPTDDPIRVRWDKFKLPLILLGALAIGGLGSRFVLNSSQPAQPRPARPIVEIVRPQVGLPDLSDVIGRLCPSVATIVPQGVDPTDRGAKPTFAFAISSDGWLLTSGAAPGERASDAILGDGQRIPIGEVRTDAVSGLTIAKLGNQTPLQPLALNDQNFPKVGQFGFTLNSPTGNGCSAGAAMIDSDFLADGGGPLSYVRVGPRPDLWGAGMPFLGADGRVIGVATADPDSSIIPAPLAALVIDELIRNSPSASTKFGFRAIDFAPPLSTRLGNVRSGAGVAFVQPKSPAATARLNAGDIVTGVNGEPVSSASELNRALDALTGNATLTIVRGTQELTLTVKRA
jgi:S1-C subfamily serine protease